MVLFEPGQVMGVLDAEAEDAVEVEGIVELLLDLEAVVA